MSGPLERVGAIKLKLGALLVGGVVVTTGVLLGGVALGLPVWLAVVAGIGIGLVAVDLLGTGLTGPLREMARQADRLAAGEPVAHVDATARDEVGALARAFNRMAREVAATDRVRRDLVANVSHELRTPLAAMSAVVENLVDGIVEPDRAQLAALEDQTGRLRSLVDQLLDLSRLDAGAVALERVPTDVEALVDEAVAGCGRDAVDRVVVEVAPEAATASLDRARFARVVVNLVGNALRHGPPDTPVRVTARRADDGAFVLVVADEGPGIDPADEQRVFERFGRADDGRDTTSGGAGLGLAITRWIVTLHGGTVAVDHDAGPGGHLRVTVPDHDERTTDRPRPTPGTTQHGRTGPTPPPSAADPATTSAPPATPSATGGRDPLHLLPTPVTGLSTRALVAVALAALVAAAVGEAAFDGIPGLGVAVLLGAGGAAALVGLERPLDRFGRACCGIAVAVVASWSVTTAVWVLVPVTLGAVVLAGLGIWGPRRPGEVLRAAVVGPLLAVAAPVAAIRGLRAQDGSRVRAAVVPAVATGFVLLVFGGLLVRGDAALARVVDAVLPDVSLDEEIVVRAALAGLVALAAVTYVLVQRAGTVPTTPWARPVRARADWLVPVAALDALLAVAIVVRVGVLFGGEQRVLSTTGLTYADYARSGFGSLLLLTVLVLGVVGPVVRVAADEDRRTRDRVLGSLLALTGVVLVSAVQRLVLYTAEFGLSRVRFSAFGALLWVALLLVLVAAAGRSRRVADSLPRTILVVSGVVALVALLSRPDAIVAAHNVERFERTGRIDVGYLAGLSDDAVPALATLPDDVAAVVLGGGCSDDDRADQGWVAANLARAAADAARAEAGVC